MSRYRLSHQAERDLLDIFRFGLVTFGERQAEAYQFSLIECFALLANNPLLGRSADAVHPGLRRHEHGSHVVFYEPESTGITVIAVIHGSAVRLLRL